MTKYEGGVHLMGAWLCMLMIDWLERLLAWAGGDRCGRV
jgi:hypothetical protein